MVGKDFSDDVTFNLALGMKETILSFPLFLLLAQNKLPSTTLAKSAGKGAKNGDNLPLA